MSGDGVLEFVLADVFAHAPYEGNGVAVFVDPPKLDGHQLLAITNEVRQFESIFLWSSGVPSTFDARVFVAEGELEFAGHPTLGAVATLHHRLSGTAGGQSRWVVRFGARAIDLTSVRIAANSFDISMEQGVPSFEPPLGDGVSADVAEALGLRAVDLDVRLPMQTVSTGLPYLMVAVRPGALERAQIRPGRLEPLLTASGASFAYLLDVAAGEARNWDNEGRVEDIATGSAAGPAAAYLVRWGLGRVGEPITIAQGRFVGRPSSMTVLVGGAPEAITSVRLTGSVQLAGVGSLHSIPPGP